jgi:hypothetical protein
MQQMWLIDNLYFFFMNHNKLLIKCQCFYKYINTLKLPQKKIKLKKQISNFKYLKSKISIQLSTYSTISIQFNLIQYVVSIVPKSYHYYTQWNSYQQMLLSSCSTYRNFSIPTITCHTFLHSFYYSSYVYWYSHKNNPPISYFIEIHMYRDLFHSHTSSFSSLISF